jgi:phosphatidylinositol alpha 1,6-mannosyltransferase
LFSTRGGNIKLNEEPVYCGVETFQSMRIAIFSEACDPQVNGVVTTLARLTPYLRCRSHQVLLVVPRYKGNSHRSDTVELKCLPFPLYPEMPVIIPHWKFHTRAFARIKAFNPDLVHIMTPGVMGFFGQT